VVLSVVWGRRRKPTLPIIPKEPVGTADGLTQTSQTLLIGIRSMDATIFKPTFCKRLTLALLVSLQMVGTGCRSGKQSEFKSCGSEDCYQAIASQIEYPEVRQCSTTCDDWASQEPLTLTSTVEPEYWDLPLEEVVQLTLTRSKVLRNLGGAVLRAPSSVRTHWDPAIRETDPRFGVDAALSAFDAQFSTSVYGEKNDKALNNEFFGGGTRLLQQDLAVIQSQLTKRTATGSQFTLRKNIEYDANNAPSNQFPSAWNVNLETEFRHPLLQGGGLLYNRIAGPTNTPGIYGGVLLARISTDVELADFELAVRDMVSNIENAYWDLYFAYRDLDSKIVARDAALETWQKIKALNEVNRQGGEAHKEAQAREQFFLFQEGVQNALSGRLIDGTRTGNGSGGGTFRPNGGVHVAERRLRMLMGFPPSDGRLIRPADEPITASVHFDWDAMTQESVVRRVELRRQRFQTRRRELEWIASKNHLLPRLDAVGRYRWRGFGDDLLDTSNGGPRFDNAYTNLATGDFQEWQVGLELNIPIGYRRAFASVRNAKLQLSRSRALLREQEHQVIHDLASAVAEMQRAFVLSQTTYNRLQAAQTQLQAVEAAFEAKEAPLDLLLDAQRRLADAQSRYYRGLAEYAVAIKNVHFAKGTLLDYDGVYLSEGGWVGQAYGDAAEKGRRRGKRVALNYASSCAPIVSRGTHQQRLDKFTVQGEPLPEGIPMESISMEEEETDVEDEETDAESIGPELSGDLPDSVFLQREEVSIEWSEASDSSAQNIEAQNAEPSVRVMQPVSFQLEHTRPPASAPPIQSDP